MSKWQLKAIGLSVLAGLALYIGATLYSGYTDVLLIIYEIGYKGIITALLLSLVNYILRFIRWQIYLQYLGYKINSLLSWRIYLSGFALTTTPGKAGEAIRSLMLRKLDIPVSTSLAALVSERFSDLLAILLLSCIGLWSYPNARLPIILTILLMSLFLFIIFYKPFIVYLARISKNKEQKIFRFLNHLVDVFRQVQACHNPSMLIVTGIISIIAWGSEAVAFYLLLYWAGFDISFNYAIFIYALSMLVGALSFLPGGLGGAEGAMVSLLVLRGVDMPSAVALTIIIRFTTLWFAVLLGAVAMYRSHRGVQTS